MEKSPKILIITYYWPPAGGIAVKRWLSLSNQFAGLNAEVHVLTLEKESAEYHSIDAGLLDSVDSRISVHRIRAWNPFQLTKKLFKKHIPPRTSHVQRMAAPHSIFWHSCAVIFSFLIQDAGGIAERTIVRHH